MEPSEEIAVIEDLERRWPEIPKDEIEVDSTHLKRGNRALRFATELDGLYVYVRCIVGTRTLVEEVIVIDPTKTIVIERALVFEMTSSAARLLDLSELRTGLKGRMKEKEIVDDTIRRHMEDVLRKFRTEPKQTKIRLTRTNPTNADSPIRAGAPGLGKRR